jgi:hypothetical protein
MKTSEIAVSSGTNSVASYHRQATDVAGVCKDIVHQTAQTIGGRKYVRVEGWQAIATAHGCVASARDVEKIDGGWRAIGEVRRMDTGATIATAEGFLGEDEPVWAKRPEYAKRAMCQTRAISRACRSAFAHVVVLIGGGLETTPAEEVPHGGFEDAPRPAAPARYNAPSKTAPRTVDAEAEVEEERIVSRDMKTGHEVKAAVRKPRPVAQQPQAADYEPVTLLKVARKTGTSAKGREWTRWGALVNRGGNEVWLNTFSENFGALLDEAQEGDVFNVELKEGDRGIDIVDLRASDVPDKMEAEDAVAEADEIPF